MTNSFISSAALTNTGDATDWIRARPVGDGTFTPVCLHMERGKTAAVIVESALTEGGTATTVATCTSGGIYRVDPTSALWYRARKTAGSDRVDVQMFAVSAADMLSNINDQQVQGLMILRGPTQSDLLGVGARVRRFNNIIGVMGDSQSANYDSPTGTDARNVISQARAMSFNRFYYDPSFKYATGGFTTSQIRATHLPQVLAETIKPSRILLHCGTNNWSVDSGTMSVQQSVAAAIADCRAIIDALNAVGIAVDWSTQWPRQFDNTAQRRDWCKLFNHYVRAERLVRNSDMFGVVDLGAALIDRTSPVGNPFAEAMWDEPTPGGLHQGILGAMAVAKVLSDYWNIVFPTFAMPITRYDDVWSSDNPFGCRNTNPLVSPAVFTGAVSGTTLTVSAVLSGTIEVGQVLTGGSLPGAGVTISAFGTGTGGTGTYTINSSQAQASTTLFSGVAPGTGVTGIVPLGWTMDRDTGSTLTAVGSIGAADAAPQGGYPYVITLGGGSGGTGKESIRLRTAFSTLTNYTVGDKIVAMFDVETSGLVNVVNCEAQFSGNISGANRFGLFSTGSNDATEREAPASRRVIETTPYTITGLEGAGIQQALFKIWADCSGSGVQGTIKIRFGGFKKVETPR
jgi:hypothetical protein